MHFYKEVWKENIDSWICWHNYEILQSKGQNIEIMDIPQLQK